MSNTEQMVSVPVELAESAVDAFASIGMHDQLERLNELLGQPAAQHQGEPAAWVIFDNGFIDDHTTDKDLADGWREQGLEVSALYTHPDAGEVERPSQIASSLQGKLKSVEHERDTLRAQLAKANYVIDHARTIDRQAFAHGTQNVGHSLFRGLGILLEQYDGALSASAEPSATKHPSIQMVRAHKYTCANVQPGSTAEDACDCGAVVDGKAVEIEPSAPVERDERARFESNYGPGTWEHVNWSVERQGWQARAALERKQ